MSEYAQDSLPAGTMVRAGIMRAPLQLLGLENRRSHDKLKREFGRRAPVRFAETLVHADQLMDCFERARFLDPDAELFLRASLSPDLAALGLFGRSGDHCETIWDGLLASQEGMSYFQPASEIHLRIANGRCRIRFDSGLDDRPGNVANVQIFLALHVYLLRMAKGYTGGNLKLFYPGARPDHYRLFPEAVTLRSGPAAIIEFDEKLLRRPLSHSDSLKHSIARSVMDKFRTDDLTLSDLPRLVREIQFSSVEAGHRAASLRDVAGLLDLPARSIQAYLETEGMRFTEIRNSVLHQIAQKDLSSGLSILETSEKLGFRQRQSFSEAFSGWEGQSPSVFASRTKNAQSATTASHRVNPT